MDVAVGADRLVEQKSNINSQRISWLVHGQDFFIGYNDTRKIIARGIWQVKFR